MIQINKYFNLPGTWINVLSVAVQPDTILTSYICSGNLKKKKFPKSAYNVSAVFVLEERFEPGECYLLWKPGQVSFC